MDVDKRLRVLEGTLGRDLRLGCGGSTGGSSSAGEKTVLGEQATERGGPRRRERQGSSAYIALTHSDDTPGAVRWRDETRKRQNSAK